MPFGRTHVDKSPHVPPRFDDSRRPRHFLFGSTCLTFLHSFEKEAKHRTSWLNFVQIVGHRLGLIKRLLSTLCQLVDVSLIIILAVTSAFASTDLSILSRKTVRCPSFLDNKNALLASLGRQFLLCGVLSPKVIRKSRSHRTVGRIWNMPMPTSARQLAFRRTTGWPTFSIRVSHDIRHSYNSENRPDKSSKNRTSSTKRMHQPARGSRYNPKIPLFRAAFVIP